MINRTCGAPRLPHAFLSRPRLLEKIDDVLSLDFLLVNAPSGTGATSLVADWCQSRQTDEPLIVVWINIDRDFESPSALQGFLTEKLGQAVLLDSPVDDERATQPTCSQRPRRAQRVQVKAHPNDFLDLCGKASPLGHDLIIVLDGIEHITVKIVHEHLEQTIINTSTQVHFILISQVVPAFRLTLRQAHGQCGIVAAADLLFANKEIGSFLRLHTGRSFSNREVKRVEELTAGRLLDLRIVTLALREDASKASGVLDGIESGTNAVLEHFIAEAISEMDERDATFLLMTSILESFTSKECDFVYQTTESAQRLEVLATSCFLAAADVPVAGSIVYSHRPILLGALQRLALTKDRFDIAQLIRRASEWHIARAGYEHVIKHCVRFKQWDLLSETMKNYGSELVQAAVLARFRGIDLGLETIEDDVLEKNPSFLVLLAHVALSKDNPDEAEQWLLMASQLMESVKRDDPASFTKLNLWIEIFLTLSKGQKANVKEGLEIGNLVIERIKKEDRFLYSWALGALGSLYQRGENLEKSIEIYQESLSVAEEVNNSLIYLVSSYFLSRQYISSGKLKRAEKVLIRAQQEVEAQNIFTIPFAGLPEVGLAHLRLAQYRTEEADRFLYQGMKRIRAGTSTEFFADAQLALAEIKQLKGDSEGAQMILEETMRYATQHSSGHSLNMARLSLARIHAINNDVASALFWLKKAESASSGEDYHLSKSFQVTRARTLIADSQVEKAIDLLKQLAARSLANQRLYDSIETHILLAAAYSKSDGQAALHSLKRAVLLAVPEGIRGPFALEKALLQPLFESLSFDEPSDILQYGSALSEFVASLQQLSHKTMPHASRATAAASNAVAAVLTRREKEVCHLLLANVPHNEIARQLFISCNTVHTHCNNIYSKLGVHNRQELASRFFPDDD
jgi:LuxR family maltose regulon positive regulatory protein